MTRRTLRRLIERHVAPAFPQLRTWKDGLVRWDGEPILRGFWFGRSDTNADGIRVHAFAQPLFVPEDLVILAVSEHLGDVFLEGASEEAAMGEVRSRAESDGRTFLARTSDCAALAADVVALSGDSMGEALAWEIRGGCLVWVGDAEAADAAFSRAAAELEGAPTAWEDEALERVTETRAALARSPAAARELLAARAQGTERALGLPEA